MALLRVEWCCPFKGAPSRDVRVNLMSPSHSKKQILFELETYFAGSQQVAQISSPSSNCWSTLLINDICIEEGTEHRCLVHYRCTRLPSPVQAVSLSSTHQLLSLQSCCARGIRFYATNRVLHRSASGQCSAIIGFDCPRWGRTMYARIALHSQVKYARRKCVIRSFRCYYLLAGPIREIVYLLIVKMQCRKARTGFGLDESK